MMTIEWNKRLRAGTLALALTAALPLALAALPADARDVQRVERGTLVTEDVPAVDEALAERYRAYLNARSAGVLDWTADGAGLLISTRFGETNQLHLVMQPLGARQQLTFKEEPITSGRLSPRAGSADLIYSWDRGGSEQFQLFRQDLKTGAVAMLTDGKSRNQGLLWSSKGDRIAFASTRRDGRNTDVYVATPEQAATVQPLVAETGSWGPVAWSADDGRLLVGKSISVARSQLWVVDVKTGEKTRVKPEMDDVHLSGVGFTPDGKGVVLVSDEAGEFKRLGIYDLAGGKTRWISEEQPWDVEEAELSHDGRLLAYTVNEAGYSTLHLLDMTSLKPLPAADLPKGTVGGLRFSPDGTRLAVSVSRPTAPSDVFVVDIAGRTVTQWTRSEVGGLNTDSFADATLVQYPTFDKVDGKPRQIPAFVYKPQGASGKLPVIIDIHGGPEGQTRPSFSSGVQFWVNELGAAVVRPNVRGSTGYGKTYVGLDNGFKREDSVKDIGALLDWIATQPDLDPKRVVVVGGSYGGYMTLASMTHFNDRLAGGSSSVGISNFVTFLESTADYRRDLRRVEYGDERDARMREHLVAISPLTNAGKITKPMLIIQGANDPRVPRGESEQMVAQIRKNGGDVWYVLAMDEGHGFRKRTNQFYAGMAQAMFFRKVFAGNGNAG
ncbi:S9 family peptidase [Rhodospirillum centenum]|uniref:Prolyl oligopeptidase family protein, putative n=1 Tax=Rhodospirillum centenum (strain ATCC 51521 / SW) TaxID=414684 RepID=B6IQU6_RHOCS|nr:prolyl oligopeptidase family serine peptidase [Rhodospirillum centenum]ACI97832.1 prolyl oligopeptidase family protein, putative [Rhodospirillum centenum SW]